MQGPSMISHDRLVALWLGCRIDSPRRDGSQGGLTKAPLDAIIDCKIYRPCGEISEDSWTKTSIHASNTIMSQGSLDDI